MPSDRDREMAQELFERARDAYGSDVDLFAETVAQARAEGFRDGLERAAQECESDAATGHALAAAIRGLAPVTDSHREDTMTEALVRSEAERRLGAKATDPRGSGLPGGEDATEITRLRTALMQCRDLFTDLRGDWSDNRPACREGWRIIDAVLSAAPEPSAPPLDRTPPAGATLSLTSQPERSGGEGK